MRSAWPKHLNFRSDADVNPKLPLFGNHGLRLIPSESWPVRLSEFLLYQNTQRYIGISREADIGADSQATIQNI